MPTISTLMEKSSKKKFKKSEYRPWNYLEEIEKERIEKKEQEILPPVDEVSPLQEKSIISLTAVSDEKILNKDILEVNENFISSEKLENEVPSQDNSALYKILRLSGYQKIIFNFILERCLSRGSLSSGFITSDILINLTNTSLNMINTSVQRLVDKSLISRENGKRGRGGFYCFSMTAFIKEAALQYKRLSDFESKEIVYKKTDESDQDQSNELSVHDSELLKNVENIDIDCLNHIGFTKSHLIQLIKNNQIELKFLQDSIYHYAFDLQYNNKMAHIKKSTPIGYFMGIMMRAGIYNPPDNYESPKDRALRELIEKKKIEQDKRNAMLKELIQIGFEQWHANLTQEEKDQLVPEEIKKSKLLSPKIASLKTYFIEKIWPTIAPENIL